MLVDEKILCHLHDVDEKSKTLIDVLLTGFVSSDTLFII